MRPTFVTLLLLGLALGQEEETPPSESAPGSNVYDTPAEQAAAKEDREARKKKAEGLAFCEFDNCYELLGVKPEAGLPAIKRAYRKLAAEYHPDKCASGDVEKCKEVFPKYAGAYEVLSNSDTRKSYDFVLANPYEFPGFYMRYSKPKYAPKSDLRFVFLIAVLGASLMQYLFKKSQHEQALVAMKKHPKTRYTERLNELLAASGSPKKGGSAKAKAGASKSSEELETKRKEAEATLDAELAAELPPMPKWTDTLAIDLFKLPLTTIKLVKWYLSGGPREPAYMTRKALGISEAEWSFYTEEEVAELVGRELWVAENLQAYTDETATSKVPLKDRSSKEKRAVRQRKHNPVNQASIMQD